MRRTSGLELLLRQKQSATLISTGDAALDAALKGGFLCGEVTELVGESSTGKTQLCHAAAASAAMVGARVVWIDATNGFSAKRLRQLASTSSAAARRCALLAVLPRPRRPCGATTQYAHGPPL